MNIVLSSIAQAMKLLPPRMDSVSARLMLVAINLQEDPERLRKQVNGPARGLYQFEQGGGVHGVLTHSASRRHAISVCNMRNVAPDAHSVYNALAGDDVLASAFARLLLWTDPSPLPAIGDVSDGWELYLRVWRPGAYKRDPDGLRKKWTVNYSKAMEIIRDA